MAIPQTTVAESAAEARGFRLRRFDATLPVWIGAALFVVLLMLLPLGAIFTTSAFTEKGLTLGNYVEVFTDPAYLKAIWNSVITSFWVGVIAVAIGALLGWLVTRTDLPFKRTVRALVMASFVTPPFLGAFAWTLCSTSSRSKVSSS
jgi:iron(III) transport system permease protein